MNRKRIGGIIAGVIAIPVLVLGGFALYLLEQAHELPWQTRPTAIPVTPFANLGSTAPAGATVVASTAATSPPAATAAPTIAATLSSTASAPGTTTASSAPASSPTAASAATAPAGSAAAKAPAGVTTYAIVGDNSEAKVTVNEKLSRLPTPSDAVLTTKAIQGQLFLGPDTKPVEGAKIMVDLRTLKSDSTQRDNFIKQDTLQATQFPLAEYVITGVDGWTGPLTEGQQSTFKLLGMMTIHGVTKPVTFDTIATMQGGNLSGTARTTFKFQDFGMSPPNVFVAKADENIKLDMTIAATKAG